MLKYRKNSNDGETNYSKTENLSHLKPRHEDNCWDEEEIGPHPMANLLALTGPDRDPVIDLNIVIETETVCMVCGIDFKSRPYLHAHLTRHKHLFGQLDSTTQMPKYECRTCENIINCVSMIKHRCFIKHVTAFKTRTIALDKHGSPLVCILCRGRLLPSRVHLVIHLIVAHSIHRDPFKCVFCHAEFASESLLMQESHAFDWHAPALFIMNRKASFKMIRNKKGNILDASVPFSCFYDMSKLECVDLNNIFGGKTRRDQNRMESSTTATQPNSVNPKICTMNFSCLAEFITHTNCFHGALAIDENENNQNNEFQDPIEKAKRSKKARTRVPGSTISEFLKSQSVGSHATNSNDLSKTSKLKGPNRVINKQFISKTNHCRICLEQVSNEHKLTEHMESDHLPESDKRLKHLTYKNQLSELLDIDRLCTECFIVFPNIISLQVHMMVSHAGKDWRHCGFCNYEFFSEKGSTPDKLNLVVYKTDIKSEGPMDTDESSLTSTLPLPPELMWRIIMTHETLHTEYLFPPRQVPYMPIQLIDQLIDGSAIQAVMAARWILKKAKEEMEGPIADDEPIAGVHGPVTTQEAFGIGRHKSRFASIDKNMVEEAAQTLSNIIKRNFMLEDSIGPTKSIAQSNHLSSYSVIVKSKLPNILVKRFIEIGERNTNRRIEHDFTENV